jgi:hypothetical protein
MCRSKLSRIERGRFRMVPVVELSRLCAILGLELSVRVYPGGQPIRDSAQQALLDRFQAAISPSIRCRREVPLPVSGDLRAWDAWLAFNEPIAVEAETRPRDLQATQRRINLKWRDDPRVAGVVLLLADTRRNRDLMREYGDALLIDYPVPGEELLADLAAGRRPRGSGVLLM